MTVLYYCDTTGVGADPAGAGLSGNDTNSGLTTLAGVTGPRKTLAQFKIDFAAAVPGDQFLLSKGGAWDGWATGTTVPRNGTIAAYKANPVIIGSFSPTQFSSSQKPRLNTVANLSTVYTITAITKANPAVVTAANALANGDRVTFGSVTNMPEINGVNAAVSAASGTGFTVDVDASVFALAGTNGTAVKALPYGDYPNGTGVAFNFWPSDSTPYGGYTIQDLEIQGADGYGTFGVIIQLSARYITVQRMTFSHLDGSAGSNGSTVGGSPLGLAFLNNTVSYMQGNGASFFASNNMLVEGNTFDHTANGNKQNNNKIRDHGLYISGNEESDATNLITTNGVVVRNNTWTNTGLNQIAMTSFAADPNRCNTPIVVGHGRIRQWLIEGNRIIQAAGTTGTGGYGLAIYPANYSGANYAEYEKFLTIRGNVVTNSGNWAIAVQAAVNCLIENNVIVKEDLFDGFTGIIVGQMQTAGGTPVTNNQAVRVRNNSLYMYGGTGVGVTGIDLGGSGTLHEIENNLIYFGSGGGTRQCFGFGLAAAAYATWNNNLGFNSTVWATGYATKALFTATNTSFDTASLTTDPVLVALPAAGNSYSMQFTGSPAKNAGHATKFARLSINNYTAVGVRDIGAYEFGSNP